MAFAYKDRVKETTTTTGTGTITLAGAVTGFRAFSAAFSTSDTMYYVIDGVNADGTASGQWEVGEGTLTGTITLARTRVIASSSGGAAVNFASGTKYVYNTVAAEALGASGTVTSVAQSFTGGIISVAGSPITSSGTLALTVAGISGGIPYFSSSSAWASSAALTANALVIGGGAGAAPSTTTTGTGVLTALGINVGSAGAFVTFNGALGTPSSGTLTNATGLPVGGISATGTPSSSTFLRGDGSWQTVSASPGGSTTQVQYNNAGAFAGAAGFTFNGTAGLTLGVAATSTGSLTLSNATSGAAILTSDAANTLALRNSTSAQTFRAYNTYTDSSNYERGIFDWAGSSNVLTIGTENAGTGSARNLRFIVGGTSRMDYGITTAFSWTIPGGTSLTMTGGGSIVGTTSLFASLIMQMQSGGNLQISDGTDTDAKMYRDTGVKGFAIRNAANAMSLRWYRTYTNSSNYERGALQTGSGFIEIAAETAGTGTDDLNVKLTPAGAGTVQFGTHSTIGAETVTGYITITDAGGTTRKLAVVS